VLAFCRPFETVCFFLELEVGPREKSPWRHSLTPTGAWPTPTSMSDSPASKTPPGAAYELLPAGLPVADTNKDTNKDANGAIEGSTPQPPSNAKFDPRWARRAATQLMDTRGVRVVEVQQTIAELRKTQAAVSRSLGETRDAVLWLQKLEVLEQQLVLVPEYRERAKKIVTDMQSIAIRVAKAKKRASALGGETFPEWDGSTQECEGN